jgi:hypothetical protein
VGLGCGDGRAERVADEILGRGDGEDGGNVALF